MGNVKISEVAVKARVLPSTIRHYTDLGLLEVSDRTDGGQRLYDEEKTFNTLAKIKHLSSRGYTLNQIKDIFAGGLKKRVLIIDDDPDVVDLIKTILKAEDWEFKHASDGFEAGTILLDYLPDLITLDLVMPGMDGFKVCQNIRKDPRTKSIKIISITAYDTPEYKEKIIKSGADGYLPKPFTPEELRTKINEVLGKVELVK
ncbi:MAG: response regulator [Elusimicrobia bacterium]|nr:response regulator [Elusimicrobiota bacterium]